MTVSSIQTPAGSGRLSSIDFVRGLVIVIMALDHIRDLLHTTALTQSPTDLATTTPLLFMTRFVTHFCAPVFVFLAGTSAFLMLKSKTNNGDARKFLFTRGLWLILLEATVICFGVWANIRFNTLLFQVIFAIGSSFVILSALISLRWQVLGALGLAIILVHDALPLQPFSEGTAGYFLWALFLHGGFFKFADTHALLIAYPVLPWLGIMLLGFSFGKAFELSPEKRRKVFLWSGSIALGGFLLLRGFNLYGDIKPWMEQQSFTYSVLSFMNVSKYPPSLLYTCMTLSVMFFVLCLAKGRSNGFSRFFVIYGRVPMFFYLIHWYVIHSSMFVMIMLQGVSWEQMPFGIMQFGRPESGVGLELPFIYLYWICLVLAMYPLCRWYGNYKAANKHKKWLAYI